MPSAIRRVLVAPALALALAGCSDLEPADVKQTPTPRATATPTPSAEDLAVTAAVGRFSTLLEAGDVAALCSPGEVLTAEVVRSLESQPGGCEDTADVLLHNVGAVALPVQRIAARADLASVRVKRPGGSTAVITLVLDADRWLISFSGAQDPLTAVLG